MTAVIQRVKCASVISDGEPTGSIDAGLMLLLGVKKGDTENDALLLAEKISKLRIFSDENGKNEQKREGYRWRRAYSI